MLITIRNAFSTFSDRKFPDVRIVIDVFRASTTVIALFESGIKELIIANDLETLEKYRSEGYTIISEVFRMGIDNSPTIVKDAGLQDKKVILKTSNLTTAIAANSSTSQMYIACFNNIHAIVDYIKENDFSWLELIPAGSMKKKRENVEDTHCAATIRKSLISCTHKKPDLQILEGRIKEKLKGLQTSHQYYIDDLYLAIETGKSLFIPVVKKLQSGVFLVKTLK